MDETPQDKQVALVTGANRGIGRAIARGLGERGFRVWIAARDETAARQTADELGGDGIDARAVRLDVTSDESIRAAVEAVEQEVDALDVLVNNAGINFGPPGDPSTESVEDVAAMFDTNTLGPLRVTQAFLPLLRRAEVGRVVMTTSGLGSLAGSLDLSHENWGVAFAGYSASKSALNMLTIKLAKELLPEGIKVNLVDPGLTATQLGGPLATRPVEEGAAVAIDLATTDHPLGPTAGFFHHDASGALARHPW